MTETNDRLITSDMFVRVYQSILDSSIWAEDSDTRIVFITLLLMAKSDGTVLASVGGLARRANVSRAATVRALESFLGPDPDDRSGVDDGRRIRKVRGGWQIVNACYYRRLRTRKQNGAAVRKRLQRDRQAETRRIAEEAEAAGVTSQSVTPDRDPDPDPNLSTKDDHLGRLGNPRGEKAECSCPPDLDLLVVDYQYFSKRFGCSTADLEQAVLDFRSYWRDGAGRGQTRNKWLARLRDDMLQKHKRSQLIGRGQERAQQTDRVEQDARTEAIIASALAGELGEKAKACALRCELPYEKRRLADRLASLWERRIAAREAA